MAEVDVKCSRYIGSAPKRLESPNERDRNTRCSSVTEKHSNSSVSVSNELRKEGEGRYVDGSVLVAPGVNPWRRQQTLTVVSSRPKRNSHSRCHNNETLEDVHLYSGTSGFLMKIGLCRDVKVSCSVQ